MRLPTLPAFPSHPLAAKGVNAFTQGHVAIFRATGGKIGSHVPGGGPMLLLNHVGAKSGKRRTTPLQYFPDGEDIVLIASKGGARKNPGWYHNLKANPVTTVELKGEQRRVQVHEASPPERAELWPKIVEMYDDYAVYQTRTDREIPVLVLKRTTGAAKT